VLNFNTYLKYGCLKVSELPLNIPVFWDMTPSSLELTTSLLTPLKKKVFS